MKEREKWKRGKDEEVNGQEEKRGALAPHWGMTFDLWPKNLQQCLLSWWLSVASPTAIPAVSDDIASQEINVNRWKMDEEPENISLCCLLRYVTMYTV